MKGILSLSIILFISLFCIPASAEDGLTPENTVILSNETDESFCRDFSSLLKRLRPEWVILDSEEVPESVRDRNLIIIGELDAEYTGTIINEFLTQEEADYIRDGHYSILEKESPWTDNKIIYICTGSDRLITKKAAEEAIKTIAENAKSGQWILPPFPSVSREEALEYIVQLQYIPEDEELPIEALGIDVNAKPPLRISTEEALRDVEYLFYLFSHGYSGYGYFIARGDFDEAKKNILEELETKSNWSPGDFSQLIHDNLTFIHDCHLNVGNIQYCSHEDFWYDTTLELSKSAGEYYFTSDNTTYKVVSINRKDPDEFMFPSLNAQGDPIYSVGTLSRSPPEPLVLIAHHNHEQHQFTITLSRSELYYDWSYLGIFREMTIGGIPVVRIMSFSDHHAEYLNQFLETAQKYKGVPCLIIDVRGNGGGNDTWPQTWVTQFTGRKPSYQSIGAEFISKTTMMGRVNMVEYLLNLYPDTRKYQTDMAWYETQADAFETWSTKPHWTKPSSPRTQVIPNDTTLIVIMDGNVGSSGEGFIHYLSQVENVVVVGENSRGALTFGPVSRHQLPHSKLFVALPINFGIFIDLEFREEKGFFPDLWVPAEDALNYAVAAVRKGTITTLQPLPEEVLQEEFIPEEFLPQGLSRVQFKSEMIFLIPATILVILGFVLMYVLKKKMLSYFAFGLSWFPFGAVLLSKESFLGYVFIIIGTIFITLNVYEWRKSTPDTSSKE